MRTLPANNMMDNKPSRNLSKSFSLGDGILSYQVADLIRNNILSGKLSVGDKIQSERELSEEFGVSRTVIREAIKLLRSYGLVKSRTGVGTFISAPDNNILELPLDFGSQSEYKKMQDLLQARELIEPRIALLAAQNANRDQISKLEILVNEMGENLDDYEKYIEIDKEFHNALAEAANNSVFLLIANSVVALLQTSRTLAIASPGANHRSNSLHHEILKAVKAHDPEAAMNAMDIHMSQVRQDITNVLKKLGNQKSKSR